MSARDNFPRLAEVAENTYDPGVRREAKRALGLIDGLFAQCDLLTRQRRRDQARRQAEQHVLEANTKTIPSDRDTECAVCAKPIEIGDLIRWRPDWPPIHETCAP